MRRLGRALYNLIVAAGIVAGSVGFLYLVHWLGQITARHH